MLHFAPGLPTRPAIAHRRDMEVHRLGQKLRLQQLAHIAQVLELGYPKQEAIWQQVSPWTLCALAFAVSALGQAIFWTYGADSSFLRLPMLGNDRSPAVITFLPFVIAALLILRRWSFAHHVNEPGMAFESRLASVLADYEPVDRVAYKRLRDAARIAGALDVNRVHQWLEDEYLALEIQESISESTSASLDRFLHKRI